MARTALVFPGQGTQYIGMSKELISKYPVAKQVFEEASDVLGLDLLKLCMESGNDILRNTANAQPAILSLSVAMFKVYMKEIGIRPILSAGHSLGEISALTCAGAIMFSDAVRIVRRRGELMNEVVMSDSGGMLAIQGCDVQTVERQCRAISTSDSYIAISNYNSSEQVVVSGHSQALSILEERMRPHAFKVLRLEVGAPFHSIILKSAAQKFGQELRRYKFNTPGWSVISSINGKIYPGGEYIGEYLTDQITAPVLWKEVMTHFIDRRIELVVELGPKTVLKNLMQADAKTITTFSFDDKKDLEDLRSLDCVNARGIKSNNTFISRCIAAAVSARNTNWHNESYHDEVIEPINKLRNLDMGNDEKNKEIDLEEMKEAIKLLKQVLEGKRTDDNTQSQIIHSLLEESGLEYYLSCSEKDAS